MLRTASVTVDAGAKRIRLARIDPDATAGMVKETALQRIEGIRAELCALQEILYADRQRSLLIIFQAMDTGGKDGAIKSLCTGLNPAGIHVTSFKAPTPIE